MKNAPVWIRVMRLKLWKLWLLTTTRIIMKQIFEIKLGN